MREIKFRAWHKPLSKMHENVQETYDSDPSGIFWGSNAIHACFWSILGEKDFEVMQFTWLKDCNGIEIFEGDILHRKVKTFSGLNYDEYCLVKWNEERAQFCCVEQKIQDSSISVHFYITNIIPYTVIWNFYENPELITK